MGFFPFPKIFAPPWIHWNEIFSPQLPTLHVSRHHWFFLTPPPSQLLPHPLQSHTLVFSPNPVFTLFPTHCKVTLGLFPKPGFTTPTLAEGKKEEERRKKRGEGVYVRQGGGRLPCEGVVIWLHEKGGWAFAHGVIDANGWGVVLGIWKVWVRNGGDEEKWKIVRESWEMRGCAHMSKWMESDMQWRPRTYDFWHGDLDFKYLYLRVWTCEVFPGKCDPGKTQNQRFL